MSNLVDPGERRSIHFVVTGKQQDCFLLESAIVPDDH